MTALNKQALREAAENATPGRWEYYPGKTSIEYNVDSMDEDQGSIVYVDSGDFTKKQTDMNGEFIAAANPDTVLALLDEVEAADRLNADYRARLDRLERRCNHQGSVYWDASGVKRCAGCGIDAAGIGVKGE